MDQPQQFNREATRRALYSFCFNMKGKEPLVYGDKIPLCYSSASS